jgi:hypothetical protein
VGYKGGVQHRRSIAALSCLLIGLSTRADDRASGFARVHEAWAHLLEAGAWSEPDVRLSDPLPPDQLGLELVDRAVISPLQAIEQLFGWDQVTQHLAVSRTEGVAPFLIVNESFATLGVAAPAQLDLADSTDPAAQLLRLAAQKTLIAERSPSLDDAWQSALANFAIDAARARQLAREALRSIPPETRQSIARALPVWFASEPIADRSTLRSQLTSLAGLDRRLLARAQLTLLTATDALLEGLPASIPAGAWRRDVPGVAGAALGPFATVAGDLYLGSSDANQWTIKDGLIVDLGGNDRYLAAQPTISLDTGAALSVVIDLDGDDDYRGAVASAWFGLAVVRDQSGTDTYQGDSFAQGAAVGGAALLVDEHGDDSYRAERFSQGAALFGVAAAVDGDGDDSWSAQRASQGFGSTRGTGVLCDVRGRDSYRLRSKSNAVASWGQGMGAGWPEVGIAGGVGILIDAATGDDRYDLDSFGQGVGVWRGLGALIEGGGDDAYTSNQHAHGFGLQRGAGVVIDLGGDDLRACRHGPAFGAAREQAVGVAIDLAGNDQSISSGAAFGGVSQHGLAWYADLVGDDLYQLANERLGFGAGGIASAIGSRGLFFDGAGTDLYPGPRCGDGRTWTHDRANLGVDRRP